MFMCFDFKNAIISEVVPVAIGYVNTQPTLERMILGLYKSVLGLAIITASTFAASAVLKSAPILPGFSGASATKINGFLVLKVSSLNLCALFLATAKTPSVVSR